MSIWRGWYSAAFAKGCCYCSSFDCYVADFEAAVGMRSQIFHYLHANSNSSASYWEARGTNPSLTAGGYIRAFIGHLHF